MDCNEFSFDALFENSAFKIYESEKLFAAFEELDTVLESFVGDAVIRSYIESAALGCTMEAQRASFEQGFCFAVKLLKGIMRI